jgi:Cys-rich protein (TIGR01571 family)
MAPCLPAYRSKDLFMARLLSAAALLLSCPISVEGDQHARQIHTPLVADGKPSQIVESQGAKSLRFLAKKAPTWSFLTEPDGEVEELEKAMDYKELFLFNSFEVVVTFVIWLVLYAAFAAFYHNRILSWAHPDQAEIRKSQSTNFSEFQEWKSGLCDCTHHPGICFWACCCPGIRWADTISKLDIHSFWIAFFSVTVIYALALLPLATWFVFVLVVMYCTYVRQQIREKFEFEEQGVGAGLKDCCSYYWCFWCTIAQDARQVRDARIAGHKALLKHMDDA